jgi:RNA-directed DNA polymerase
MSKFVFFKESYSLYDKICTDYILITAYNRVKKNYSKGVGVDNVGFEDIESKGVLEFISNLQSELRQKNYRADAVRRVLIPKEKKGEFRPLGIPTVKDRVVQMAVKLLIEPLFECDFISTSYGFRPKKSAHDAIKQIKQNIYQGYQCVYDADLSKYFDTIPHDKMFRLLKKRIRPARHTHCPLRG